MGTHVLVWMILGSIAAAIALFTQHRRAPRDWAVGFGLGIGGALVGGMIARAIQLPAAGASSTSMGALAASVLALSIYYVVVSHGEMTPIRARRRRRP